MGSSLVGQLPGEIWKEGRCCTNLIGLKVGSCPEVEISELHRLEVTQSGLSFQQ